MPYPVMNLSLAIVIYIFWFLCNLPMDHAFFHSEKLVFVLFVIFFTKSLIKKET